MDIFVFILAINVMFNSRIKGSIEYYSVCATAQQYAFVVNQSDCEFVLQVIVYVEDVNDESPVFTQSQYNRLGLRETAGIGTSVVVVRATDPDTGTRHKKFEHTMHAFP